jgi:hypothetical protein
MSICHLTINEPLNDQPKANIRIQKNIVDRVIHVYTDRLPEIEEGFFTLNTQRFVIQWSKKCKHIFCIPFVPHNGTTEATPEDFEDI